MRKLKQVQIVFENCEASDRLNIKEDVYSISLQDIKRYVATIAQNSTKECFLVEDAFIVLEKGADEKFTSLDGTKYSLFQRILDRPDITHIICTYTDGTEEDIGIAWDEGNEECNVRQQVVRDGDQLCIKIEERKYDYGT